MAYEFSLRYTILSHKYHIVIAPTSKGLTGEPPYKFPMSPVYPRGSYSLAKPCVKLRAGTQIPVWEEWSVLKSNDIDNLVIEICLG